MGRVCVNGTYEAKFAIIYGRGVECLISETSLETGIKSKEKAERKEEYQCPSETWMRFFVKRSEGVQRICERRMGRGSRQGSVLR